MAIRIVQIHAADSAKALNSEWFVIENDGDSPFKTRNCTLSAGRKGQKKRRELGTLDPGFTLAPGGRVRVITGSPGKKAHGNPPKDDLENYHLFLNAPLLRGAGTVLVFALRSHALARAIFDPDAESGVAVED